jgi:GH24 family phage-related lysozyme (muramidase)
MKSLQKLSKRDMDFVSHVNVVWDSYRSLDNYEREKFKVRWERMLEHEAACVSRHLKGKRIPPHEFAALVSFRMSIPSWNSFTKTRLAAFGREGRFEMIPSEIMKFTTVNGEWNEKLENQRRAEVDLFRSGQYPAIPEDIWAV